MKFWTRLGGILKLSKLILATYFIVILFILQVMLWTFYHGDYILGALYLPFVVYGIKDFVDIWEVE